MGVLLIGWLPSTFEAEDQLQKLHIGMDWTGIEGETGLILSERGNFRLDKIFSIPRLYHFLDGQNCIEENKHRHARGTQERLEVVFGCR